MTGPALRATSICAPCRSGESTGEATALTPRTAVNRSRIGSSCAVVSVPVFDLTYTCSGSLAPFDSAAEISSAVRVAAVDGPPVMS